jgi:hypothetical protein
MTTDTSMLTKVRRHHALEHATIRILNRRFPTLRLAGWSAPGGFFVYGDVSTPDVQNAVAEALIRFSQGERHLAIHPHCGTNLVTAGVLAGLFSFVSMLPGDRRARQARLPLVLLLSTLALMLAQPLGLVVQQHVTTDTNLTGVSSVRIDSWAEHPSTASSWSTRAGPDHVLCL